MALLEDLQAQIQGYVLLEQVGSGGMGVVFRARQESLRRDVAIKFLTTGIDVSDSSYIRFRSEGLMYPRLSHPNIIKVYDTSLDGPGVPWIAFDLVAGPDLRQLLMRGRVREPESLCLQLLAGLAYIHSHGILHRDLKPGNLLVTEDDRFIITDFGLARSIEATSAGVTRQGYLVGTPAYMAPELLMGETASMRSDIYAAGLVMYEIACRALVFSQDAASPFTFAHRLREPVPALRSRMSDCSSRLVAIIDECLAFDARDRPRSAEDALRRVGGHDARRAIHASSKDDATEERPAPMAQGEPAASDVAEGQGLDRRRRTQPSLDPARPASGGEGGAGLAFSAAGRLGIAAFTALTCAIVVGLLVRASMPGRGASPATPMSERVGSIQGGATTAIADGALDVDPDGTLSLGEARTLAQAARRIDRLWLGKTLASRADAQGVWAASIDEAQDLAMKALEDLGVDVTLRHVLAQGRARVSPPSAVAPRSAWADAQPLAFYEEVLSLRHVPWPYASLAEQIDRRYARIAARDLKDDTWTNVVKGSLTHEDVFADDTRFKSGPFSYTFVLPQASWREARVVFAIAHPSSSYALETTVNGHRMALRQLADAASPGVYIPCARTDEQGTGNWDHGRVALLTDARLAGARCYLGRAIPAQWVHPGANTVVVNEWDIPGVPLEDPEPPAVTAKIVSVR